MKRLERLFQSHCKAIMITIRFLFFCLFLQTLTASEWESISTEFFQRLIDEKSPDNNWIIKFRKSSKGSVWSVRFDDVTNGLKRRALERPFQESTEWVAARDSGWDAIRLMLSTAEASSWKNFVEKVLGENIERSGQGKVSDFDDELTEKFIASELGESLLKDLQKKWPEITISIHGGELSYDYDGEKKKAIIGVDSLILLVRKN